MKRGDAWRKRRKEMEKETNDVDDGESRKCPSSKARLLLGGGRKGGEGEEEMEENKRGRKGGGGRGKMSFERKPLLICAINRGIGYINSLFLPLTVRK